MLTSHRNCLYQGSYVSLPRPQIAQNIYIRSIGRVYASSDANKLLDNFLELGRYTSTYPDDRYFTCISVLYGVQHCLSMTKINIGFDRRIINIGVRRTDFSLEDG